MNLDDVEAESGWRNLGRAAGSVRTGLKHVAVPAGQLHAPPHCHSAEEEIFVVLDGDGALELTPCRRRSTTARSRRPTRSARATWSHGHRGTRIAHAVRAGSEGLTLLIYGTKDPNDITYYPRSNEIFFRGVGLIARLDHLAYEVGEESTT